MEIRVKTEELKKILEVNRSKHKEDYYEALEKYHVLVEEKALAIAKRAKERTLLGSKNSTYIDAPRPEEHTKDYDRVLAMLGLHQEGTIVLSEEQYSNFVDDEWHWSRSYEAATLSYKNIR